MMKQDLTNDNTLDPAEGSAVTNDVGVLSQEEIITTNDVGVLRQEEIIPTNLTSPVIEEGIIEDTSCEQVGVAVETNPPDADDIAAAVAAAEAAGSTIDAVVTAHGDDDVFNNAASIVVTTNDSIPSHEDQVTTEVTEEDIQPPMEQEEQQQERTQVEIDGAMIAEAAAAAVAAVGDVQLEEVDPVQLAVDAALAADRHDEDEAAAAAAVAAVSAFETENNNAEAELDDADTKKNEQRRKRYREKSVEDEADPPIKKQATTQASHEDQLASRRQKDRQRYAGMTPDQRQVYNAKRRDQYHRQSENSRQRRRERERERYHSLENEDAKTRNTRRAKLERERYQRLDPESLEQKNRKRRERAASARAKKAIERNNEGNPIPTAVAQIAPTDDVTAVAPAAAPMDDVPPTVTDAPAPVADSVADSMVTDDVKAAEENLENSIPKEEQIALAATEVEKAAVEAAVEAVENHHVSV